MLELGAVELMKRRLGKFLAEPYESGKPKRYERLAKTFCGLGAAVVALTGHKSRTAAAVGGAMILAVAVL